MNATGEVRTITEFLAEMGDKKWGWQDRRQIDGTIRVITGPYAGQVLGTDTAHV